MAKTPAQLVSFSLLLLLLLSCSVEGSRQLVAKEGDGEKLVMEGAMIGSRLPSCQGMCSNCEHCEAVQVPLAPQEKERRAMVMDSAASTATVNSRGDEYSSNYKPINWKCKCGDMILHP